MSATLSRINLYEALTHAARVTDKSSKLAFAKFARLEARAGEVDDDLLAYLDTETLLKLVAAIPEGAITLTLKNNGTCFWIDCGNLKESGQVLIGRNSPGEKVKTFPLQGRCAWLPLPSRQHKELIGRAGASDDNEDGEDNAEEEIGGNEPEGVPVITDGLSCAEIAMLDEQGLSINQAIAAIAADYLLRLLLTQNLDKFQTYIDLASGSMRSSYITPANVRRWKR